MSKLDKEHLKNVIRELKKSKILVSLFIDPDFRQIEAASQVEADYIEIHTGRYAQAEGFAQDDELQSVRLAAQYAHSLNLRVNAGHGLKYHNVRSISKISLIEELNIGHSIVSKAVFVGMKSAVAEMKSLIQ